jgi:hypothetical protein
LVVSLGIGDGQLHVGRLERRPPLLEPGSQSIPGAPRVPDFFQESSSLTVGAQQWR